MATFADKFLKDLEELSDDDEQIQEEEEESKGENADEEMDKDYAEYEEREQKVEKLMAKGYQSKIRGNQSFQEHIRQLERNLAGEKVSEKYENLS